jgi:hypothetical protein
MNSKVAVVIGLIIALIVLTCPFWYALAAGRPDPPPSSALPEGHCIEKDMRARHMQVIDEWRDAVVREGITEEYESEDFPGESYVRSLTKTCLLECHAHDGRADEGLSVQQRFCNECHQYANVRPNCWDCHLEGSP